jgi:hypothetical protein
MYQNPWKAAVTAALVLFLAGGCGKKGGEGEPLANAEGILGFVPADTAYVFATPARMPEDVLDKLEANTDSIYEAYETVIRASMTGMAEELESQGDEEQAQLLMSLIGELAGLMQSENLRAAGVPRGPQMALYGVGLVPVFRLELDNPVAFEAKIAELEASAGGEMAEGEVEGQAYRYIGDDQGRLLMAVIDDYYVVTIVPTALSEQQLSRVLGLEKPNRNIAQAETLADLAEEYRLTPFGLGYVDVEALAAVFLDEPRGINAELLGLAGYDPADLTDVCRSEIRAMARVVPRLVAGYTDVSTGRIGSTTIIELRDDLAAALSALAAPVPGLGAEHGGLGSFGVSFDLLAAREFFEARLDAIDAAPYECEYFADMQAGLEQGRQSLNQPVPPLVYGFNGFLAIIDRIEGLDISGQQPPTDVEARLLIAIENAEGLLAMGAMFSPELASLNLQPDGKPVELPVPQIVSQFDTAWVAMTPGALAISVGNASPDSLADLLASPASVPPPSMSMRLDGKRYYQFMSEAVRAGSAAQGDDMPEDVQEAVSQVMAGVSEMVERLSVDVKLTEHGIEIPASVTLAD